MSQRHIVIRGMIAVLRGGIRGYAWLVSPLMGPKCRFHPTCSSYAVQALGRHGLLAGIWLAMRRIASCHPWSRRQGLDPVPDQFEWRSQFGYKRGSLHKKTNSDCNDETLKP